MKTDEHNPKPTDPAVPPAPAVTQDYSELPTPTNHTVNPPTPPDAPPDVADQLSDRQRAALDLMLLGASDTAIAEQLHIARKTLYNWRTHDPHFRAALATRRDQLHNHVTDRFRSLLTSALDALDKQVHDRYTPTAFRAARALLSLAHVGHHAAPHEPRKTSTAAPDKPLR